jgi:hypothetical protein
VNTLASSPVMIGGGPSKSAVLADGIAADKASGISLSLRLI